MVICHSTDRSRTDLSIDRFQKNLKIGIDADEICGACTGEQIAEAESFFNAFKIKIFLPE